MLRRARDLALLVILLATALVHGACAAKVSAEIATPAPPAEPEPQVEDEGEPVVSAVAWVGEVPITTEAFDSIYLLKLQKYEDRGREIPQTADRRYKRSITDRLIYQELLRQEAAKRGLDYDEDELARREASQRRGIDDWDQHLRRRGESDESLRQLYIAELRERAILEAEGTLEVTQAELRAEYDEIKSNYVKDVERVHAAHILILVGPRPKPGEPPVEPTAAQKKQWEAEAKAKIERVHAAVTAPGADFAEIAIEQSEGPSARKGGDLGIFAADRMVEEFSRAAFALKPGEISKPVRTKFGFHVIKVYAKYPPGALPYEALEGQIRERLESRKLHQGRRELRDALYEAYEIVNITEELLGPDPRRDREPVE